MYKNTYTGAILLAGVDISTRLCMTFARVTYVTLSKLNGGDNSYLRDANIGCLHRSVLTTSHRLHANIIHNLEKISSPASRFATVTNKGSQESMYKGQQYEYTEYKRQQYEYTE